MRDYQIISPSLGGVLSHDSLLYDGIKRPIEILRFLDGPAMRGRRVPVEDGEKEITSQNGRNLNEAESKVLQEYFYDLYSIFMKKLSHFLVEATTSDEDKIKLQAMLQEMIKIKEWVVEK